jgi:hypothetical protein
MVVISIWYKGSREWNRYMMKQKVVPCSGPNELGQAYSKYHYCIFCVFYCEVNSMTIWPPRPLSCTVICVCVMSVIRHSCSDAPCSDTSNFSLIRYKIRFIASTLHEKSAFANHCVRFGIAPGA